MENLSEILDQGCLDSLTDIEQLILVLKELDGKVDWYKKLKASRVKSCDEKIRRCEDTKVKLRQIIQSTINTHAPKQKIFDFPAVGKISRRKAKGDWNIDDRDAMLAFFDKHGVKGDVVKIEEKMDLRKAKSILTSLSDQNINAPGATFVEGVGGITIKMDSPETPDPGTANNHSPVDAKRNEALDSLEALEF